MNAAFRKFAPVTAEIVGSSCVPDIGPIHYWVGVVRPTLSLLRELRVGHQYRHLHCHFPDGVPHPEHAEPSATAVQVNLGTISLERGRGDEKLAGCAAIIAVPTMIAGIYGINFKDMPEFELK